MDSHLRAADEWVRIIEKGDGPKTDDVDFCILQSRRHLLFLMSLSAELIDIQKGIRRRLTMLIVLLALVFVLLGLLRS